MAHPVVHFEITGKDPAKLRSYYGELFGWSFEVGGPVAAAISEAGNYGFVDRVSDGAIPGGVGGGADYDGYVTFYVCVPDVEAALQQAERLGGTRRIGPETVRETGLVMGHFADPEGHLIGLVQLP